MDIAAPPDEPPMELSTEDFQLLYESFIERIPMDVIGRRRGGLSRHAVRRMIQGAVERLKAVAG